MKRSSVRRLPPNNIIASSTRPGGGTKVAFLEVNPCVIVSLEKLAWSKDNAYAFQY